MSEKRACERKCVLAQELGLAGVGELEEGEWDFRKLLNQILARACTQTPVHIPLTDIPCTRAHPTHGHPNVCRVLSRGVAWCLVSCHAIVSLSAFVCVCMCVRACPGALCLVPALKHSKSLRSLNLESNRLGTRGAQVHGLLTLGHAHIWVLG